MVQILVMPLLWSFLYSYLTFQLHLCAQISIETMHASQCGLHPTKIWISVFSFTFVQYFIFFVCILKHIGIFILIFRQYLPLYIYANLNKLGNVTHSIFVSPLHFIFHMNCLFSQILGFCKCTLFYHFILIVPIILWLFLWLFILWSIMDY